VAAPIPSEPPKYKHKVDCLWATELPTGCGFWGCTCGLDNLLLQLEDFESDCRAAASPKPEGPPEESHPEAWGVVNRQRGLLIDKKIAGTITGRESDLLEGLQMCADRYLSPLVAKKYAFIKQPAERPEGGEGPFCECGQPEGSHYMDGLCPTRFFRPASPAPSAAPTCPTDAELRLVSKLLHMASDVFSNHGCNDLYHEFWDEVGMSPEERAKLLKEMQEWNGDKESPWPETIEHIQDSALMHFYADKLRRGAGAKPGGRE